MEVRERYFGRGNSLANDLEVSKCLNSCVDKAGWGRVGRVRGCPPAFLFTAALGFSLEVGTV